MHRQGMSSDNMVRYLLEQRVPLGKYCNGSKFQDTKFLCFVFKVMSPGAQLAFTPHTSLMDPIRSTQFAYPS